MTTINCLFVDDYSYEDIFKIKIKENETVGNLVEAIKKRNIGFGGDGLKILKIDLPLGTLSDKLALIESKSFVNIKTFLGGEELPSTKLISECFDTGEHYIVIDPPSGRFTFKKCVSENKLVVGDKIIYNDNNTCLEGTIVNISNTFQIKCTKVKEYCLDSFSKFIKLAISPYDIESEHWKNLSIELSESKEKFIWRDFRRRMLNRNLKGTDLIDPVLEREKKNNEAKTEKHDADDIIYNRIRLCPPSIEREPCEMMETTNYASNNGGGSTSGGCSGPDGNKSALYEREYYFPKVKNRIVESLVGTEKQGSLDLGTSSKAGFLMKKSESTKTISDEWHLKTWGCGTTGDHWMYER
ncbi:11391_t:CDS:2, partial [Funneliformis geosporum]